ncbi:MAG: hypothetical protein GX752_01355 [Clostridium sp.]|nr:hypothetical protein [Clostridium sp.]
MKKHKANILIIVILILLGVGCKDNNIFEDDFNEVVEQNTEKIEITGEIIVEIKGEVSKPGVYKVREGDRLNDLLLLAGGETEEADLKNTNLALKILDGESFYIPKEGEEETRLNISSGTGHIGGGNSENELIDLNKATKDDLVKVPGIGPQTADNILNYREEFGSFKNVEDLLNVNRIGEKTLEKIRSYFLVR